MEILQTVGLVVGIIVGVCTIIAGIPPTVRWLRSWKILRLKEFERLIAIESDHQKCEAEKERLRKLDNPMAREIRAQIERAQKPQDVEVDSKFHLLFAEKNRK